MGYLELNGITVNNGTKDTNVKSNYYANDAAFTSTKEQTKKTPIFDQVVADVSDNKASLRDLQARDILAKYLGGVSGYKQIMGTPLEKAFIEANKDDFKKSGTVERDGKKYDVYTFNAKTSDGKITLPSAEISKEDGSEVFALNGGIFNKNGSGYISEQYKDYVYGRYGSEEGNKILDRVYSTGKE